MPSFEQKFKSISKACTITEQIFDSVLRNFSLFSTEKEVADFVQTQMKHFGVKQSFQTIVGSGPGGSEPHHKPSLKLSKGFCVIDLGVKVNGYCSDFTRTVYLGAPSKQDIAIYNKVLAAQNSGIALLAPKRPGIEPYNEACKVLGTDAKYFIHGLGHGVGKRIHIKPYMKKTFKDVLKQGDFVTVEPGVYFKGKFGIRIEDLFLITEKGSLPLTLFSRELISVPFKAK